MRTLLFLLTWLNVAIISGQSTGKILILSNVQGEVLVNGIMIGHASPDQPLVREVEVGDHFVQLVPSQGDKVNEMVTVEAGRQKAVHFKIEAPTGGHSGATSSQRIIVADQNVLVPGVLVNSLNGEVKTSDFMYAFEAGDEVVLDITMSNLKGTNSLRVTTHPGGVVLYSNLAFQALTDQRFKIQERGILKFSLSTNHMIDRNAFVKVWRIPASAATATFNTNVIQKRVYTPFEIVEKHELIVHSRSNMTGNTRAVVPVSLPPNTVEWYYRFSARKNDTGPSANTSTNTLATELASALLGSNAMVGTVTGLLGSLSTPAGAEACDVFLIDQANYNAFLSKETFSKESAASLINFNSGNMRVDCCVQGQWYLGLRNNAFMDGIKVQLEVVAITSHEEWVMEAHL